MSYENIVMTGIYFEKDLLGGNLRFKRTFHRYENDQLKGLPQYPPDVCYDFAEEGFVPLGRFPTKEGYILVFPNCHIHKIAKFVNESKTKAASRRIIVSLLLTLRRRSFQQWKYRHSKTRLTVRLRKTIVCSLWRNVNLTSKN